MATRTQGFTLLEAIVSLALVLVVLSLGLPPFGRLLDRHRELATTNELLAHLALARSWAIARGQPVALCPSKTQGRCAPDIDWSGNWMIYTDPDGDRQPNRPDDILAEAAAPSHPRLRIVSSSGRSQMRYLPDGRAAGSNLTFSICRRHAIMTEVIVSATGRARSVRHAGGHRCRP
ncbi:GspH/FimT family pseudopilin [Xanthomonas sacchari]|uniref:GspH/FimT family pseudopilin n=1 Tax=Xanthomonas sp. SHU 308 TaxID=1591201 RepID=UPI0009D9A28D|nr:GspH/FimT family protein [Xanthomonas sp. SHU 308]